MITELTEYGARSDQNEILARNIDSIVQEGIEERARITSEYIGMVLEPLRSRGLDVKILEHLKIDFLDVDKRPLADEIKIKEGTRLGLVQKEILAEFGTEVLRRLGLHLTRKKANIFRG